MGNFKASLIRVGNIAATHFEFEERCLYGCLRASRVRPSSEWQGCFSVCVDEAKAQVLSIFFTHYTVKHRVPSVSLL